MKFSIHRPIPSALTGSGFQSQPNDYLENPPFNTLPEWLKNQVRAFEHQHGPAFTGTGPWLHPSCALEGEPGLLGQLRQYGLPIANSTDVDHCPSRDGSFPRF